MSRWKLPLKISLCFLNSGKKEKEQKKKSSLHTKSPSRLSKKLNSKAHSTNLKTNCLQYCRSIPERVEPKARIGLKCLHACTGCMVKSSGGVLLFWIGLMAMVQELKHAHCNSMGPLLMVF